MSLADFTPEWEVVKFSSKGSFKVRGVSLDDFTCLIRTHFAAAASLLGVWQGSREANVIVAALQDSPLMTAHLIAMASEDGGGAFEIAMKLPVPVQIDALEKILKLTFETVGGTGKGIAMMAQLARSMLASDQAANVADLMRVEKTP